ncbi:HAMP domain-containing sensor histidine kinase [Sphingomonas naphthae]|uniref:histidine kinase n=1 Tax=Sphingomonas naphthae TaxID=1813468 RepID=A0ABY7THN2_9SPHN|nr:HAMP domain-containing sensor histidine kinase [Sphingomonas naphthae]WCT72737.1 HAMP domain-containing sensor histidine kinase [Sphingomonas naphthae]
MAGVVACALLTLAVYLFAHRAIDLFVDHRLANEASLLIGPSTAPAVGDVIERVNALKDRRDTADIGAALFDRAGNQLAGRLRLQRPPVLGASALGKRDRIPAIERGRALGRRFGDNMVLVVVADSEPVPHFDLLLLGILSLGSLMVASATGVSLLLAARVVGRHMRDMRGAAEAIIGGDLRRRIPETGGDTEFDRQAHTFNRMLDRIDELMGSLRHVAQDAAHDLRSPLVRLQTRLTRLSQQAGLGAHEAEVEAALADCEAMVELLATVLRIAEVEGGSRRSQFAPVRLDELAARMVALYEPMVRDGGRMLELAGTAPISLRGDRPMLSQLLANLIENAHRHTPPGSRIRVSVRTEDRDVAILEVTDDGPGIPPSARAMALRRFGRLEASRSTEGHGLGLSLVGAVAKLHGGGVVLGDAAPGLRVTIRLPV